MQQITPRAKRLALYLVLLIAIVGWRAVRQYWSPKLTITTSHYTIDSTATPEQTREIGTVADTLYAAYMRFLPELGVDPQPHGKLKMKLYRDRNEFRRCNPTCGWAEAFYRRPYCHQYYSSEEVNPYHWMVHEATHQLNAEVAGLSVSQWLEEGIACYFSTGQIVDDRLVPGRIDANTYPVWHATYLAMTGDLEVDKANASVIPLRVIISGSGGPDMDRAFNLYYLHWWSLAHFLLQHQDGKYRNGVSKLIHTDCGIEAFEQHIGDIEQIELEWYRHVFKLKRELAGVR